MADKKVIVEPDITAKQKINLGEEGNEYLRCLSVGNHPIVKACDGSKTFSKAKDVFPGWIDSDFVSWNANGNGVATPKMFTPVFEQIKDGTFGQILGIDVNNLFNPNFADIKKLRQMIMTPHQIIDFCINNRTWLKSDGSATFFPYESHHRVFFFASVRFSPDGLLGVDVGRFEYSSERGADIRRRFVLSRLVKHPVA